jgi:hypothetical protein
MKMTTHATATFAVKSWYEKTWEGKPHNEVEGEKLTIAQVVDSYEGEIVGEGTLKNVMYYPGDGTAVFNGLEKIVGTLGGRSGSFVVQHIGTFGAEGVKTTISVVLNSGTGELKGLSGKGVVNLAGHAERYPISLDYDLE